MRRKARLDPPGTLHHVIIRGIELGSQPHLVGGGLVWSLRNGSRGREVSQVRAELATRLTVEQGLSFAEAARQLGITTSAVARIIDRKS